MVKLFSTASVSLEYVISVVFLYLVGSKDIGLFYCSLPAPSPNADIYMTVYIVCYIESSLFGNLIVLTPGNEPECSLGGSVPLCGSTDLSKYLVCVCVCAPDSLEQLTQGPDSVYLLTAGPSCCLQR